MKRTKTTLCCDVEQYKETRGPLHIPPFCYQSKTQALLSWTV